MLICLCPCLDYNLGNQIVMTHKSLHSFPVFVSVAVKHFTKSDGINHLWSNKYQILLVCVCSLVLVIQHTNSIFPMQHYIVMCGLSGCTIFFQSHKRHDFWKKFIEYKMCVLTSSKTFLWNIFHFKKNWVRYHKCT